MKKTRSARSWLCVVGMLFLLLGVHSIAAAQHGHGPQAATPGVALAGDKVPGDDIQQVPACPFCGMDRQKFAHSRVFIQYDDGSVLGTCSIHCAGVDMAVHIDKTPLRTWVGDYNTKQLIDAEKAVWVVGGNKMGVMTKRAKWAFETREAADQFIKAEGGKISVFDESLKYAFEDMHEDTKMIRERRKARRMGAAPKTH